MNQVSLIETMVVEDFERVMDANVRGSWLMCQAAGRVFEKQSGGGSVVLVSSTRGKLGHPAGYSAYCASKAAVDLMAKSLAAEWGARGVRVNVIAPTVFRWSSPPGCTPTTTRPQNPRGDAGPHSARTIRPNRMISPAPWSSC